MTTAVVTLGNGAWTAVCVGACLVTLAEDVENASGPNRTGGVEDGVLFHVGTVSPALGTFAYHELNVPLNYTGTETVYMRSKSTTRVIKVTPIV